MTEQAQIAKPQPRAELVIQINPSLQTIYIYSATKEIADWVKTEARNFGKSSTVDSFAQTQFLDVSPIYETKDVIAYLRKASGVTSIVIDSRGKRLVEYDDEPTKIWVQRVGNAFVDYFGGTTDDPDYADYDEEPQNDNSQAAL